MRKAVPAFVSEESDRRRSAVPAVLNLVLNLVLHLVL